MAKIGRNDPSPCGSGKKYKHCCHGKEAPALTSEDAWTEDPDWYKIRLAEGESIHEILAFAVEQYGDDFLPEALAEFGIWGEHSVDDQHIDTIFVPWVAFNWMPETSESGRSGLEFVEQALGLEFLHENIERIDEYKGRFILTACVEPFSFFAVTGVVPGKSLALLDIFLDRTFRETKREGKPRTTGW